MKIIKLLVISSAVMGFVGTLLMVRGILLSSPKDFANLGGLYFGLTPYLLRNMAESRADNLFGVVLISASFFIQLFLCLFEKRLEYSYLKLNMRLKISGVMLAVLLTITISLSYKEMIDNTLFATIKELAYSGLEKQFKYNKEHQIMHGQKVILSESQLAVVYRHINDLSFKKNQEESEADYLRRFYSYLGLNFVDEIDFSKSGGK